MSRNLRKVDVTNAGALDVKDVLRYERLVFTTDAFDAITALLAKGEK